MVYPLQCSKPYLVLYQHCSFQGSYLIRPLFFQLKLKAEVGNCLYCSYCGLLWIFLMLWRFLHLLQIVKLRTILEESGGLFRCFCGFNLHKWRAVRNILFISFSPFFQLCQLLPYLLRFYKTSNLW